MHLDLCFLGGIVQFGAALAATLNHLMMEKCHPVCLAISFRYTFSLFGVKFVAFPPHDDYLVGMMENVEKNFWRAKERG